ncbi:hypothetical protein W02_17440 [Nitrospira sp. KM1]|uniref:hypothetical protein n=1 Tax=Nitrospira sp. KM1 TaxID=1936990 RepID=UPI0013A72A6B|nr:hypothetical protein [Nitrospira sp. KM1]BCA54604.1 hypothetical protein W02_17440 [Nitrospira sp. KM1]
MSTLSTNKRESYFKNVLGAVFVVMLMSGCALGLDQATETPHDEVVKGMSQREAGDSVFKYRSQAAELRSMAARYELEAQQFIRLRGEGDEQARRSLDNAKVLWAAADEADELAREYRSQVPHAQIN